MHCQGYTGHFILIFLYRKQILYICDHWDIWSECWGDMTWPKKFTKTNKKTKTNTMTKTKTFCEPLLRAILETCDLWDICPEWWEDMTWPNHRKNCECCPVSQLIVRSQRLSWIQVLNCQNCSQCLKCRKSLGLSLLMSLYWSLSNIVRNCQNSQNKPILANIGKLEV